MVDVPDRMQYLDRDPVGRPIPIIVRRMPDGTPLFAVNDTETHRKCVMRKLCQICGQKLIRDLWFVGGPMSAFHRWGFYYDSAMHHECATFALKVCPYLAVRNYNPTADARSPALAAKLPGTRLIDNTIDSRRPKIFVAIRSYGQSVEDSEKPRRGMYSIRPLKPYFSVEFWQHGAQIELNMGINELIIMHPELRKPMRDALYLIPGVRLGQIDV